MTTALERDLRRHVECLAGEIGERHVWRPAALRAAEAFIRDQFAAQGYEVALQSYTTHGVESSNLEVTVHGRSRAGEVVVIGAHYDTVRGSPGANDNASGVAALLEIARALREMRPARTIRLVAFVNEEPPFFYFGEMGSQVYARAARRGGDDIRAKLSLETLGYYSDVPGSQAYPPLFQFFYPDRGNFVAFVSNLRSRRVLREVAAAFKASSDFPAERLASPGLVPGVSWSDHLSFWRAGYPGIMVTDTAFYRYPYYHASGDTPERLSYAALARVVAGLQGAIAMLAGA
jgi:Zn-dependent M28 family amino/carboxypeptidase